MNTEQANQRNTTALNRLIGALERQSEALSRRRTAREKGTRNPDHTALAISLAVIQQPASVILQAIEPCEATAANPQFS